MIHLSSAGFEPITQAENEISLLNFQAKKLRLFIYLLVTGMITGVYCIQLPIIVTIISWMITY